MALVCGTGRSELLEDGFEAGQEAAREAGGKVPAGGRAVGILFASAAFDLGEVVRGVRSVLDAPLVGCTTFSEATEAGYTDDSVTLLVLSSPDLDLGIGLGTGVAADPVGAAERAWRQARESLRGEPRLAITFPDASLSHQGERVVEALNRLAGDVPVAGGCPGDGGKFEKTYQVAGDQVTSDAMPILLLAGVDPIVLTTTGWTPMGAAGKVTRASANRLYEIDGRPAIDFMRNYIEDIDSPTVMGSFPMALIDETARKGGRDHYVIRSPFFYDPATDSIALGGVMPEGASVQLGRSSREITLQSAGEVGADLRARLGGRAPACLLFASCGARKLTLGLAVADEIKRLTDSFGHTPIAGFYSYGEIGAFDSSDVALRRARFHNATLMLCAICG